MCVRNIKIKKVTYSGKFLKNWDDESELTQFLTDCNGGSGTEDNGWANFKKYPEIEAKSNKPKVVAAPRREGLQSGDDGTKKGGKERVGRRVESAEDDEVDSAFFF